MGDFLAIVKEKNFIEVVSRSINQVDMLVNSSRKYIIVQGDYHHGGRPQGSLERTWSKMLTGWTGMDTP